MKPKLDSDFKDKVKNLSFDEQRVVIGHFLKSQHGARLWNLLTCLRGPDSPSEKPNMSYDKKKVTYAGRRKRKYNTVEVIRDKAFFGVIGGSARSHEADLVTIPPSSEWDHFDRHVAKAADAIGLKVEYGPGVDVPSGSF